MEIGRFVCAGPNESRNEMALPDMLYSGKLVEGSARTLALPIASKASSLPLPTRIAFIGNYLPRECGIATFTTDLCTALSTEYGAARLMALPVNDTEIGRAHV